MGQCVIFNLLLLLNKQVFILIIEITTFRYLLVLFFFIKQVFILFIQITTFKNLLELLLLIILVFLIEITTFRQSLFLLINLVFLIEITTFRCDLFIIIIFNKFFIFLRKKFRTTAIIRFIIFISIYQIHLRPYLL